MVNIRPMRHGDLPAALDLVRSVGWNQTEQDLRLFLEGRHNIYLGAEAEGKVVGTVASMHYGRELAWISMMIIAEAWRGRGISRMLLNAITGQLRQRGYGTIKLDATPAGRPVYERLGFTEEYTIHRLVHPGWEGRPATVTGPGIRPVTAAELPVVIGMDRAVFGADRSVLIRHLAQHHLGYVLMAGSEMLAYGLSRAGRVFHQIGPVAGADEDSVRKVLQALLDGRSGKAVAADILADKGELQKEMLGGMGFSYQRPFYRMFLNVNGAAGRPDHHYLIAGPEFG